MTATDGETDTAAQIARFVASLREQPLPRAVADMAKQSLVDWFAVCFAALEDREARLAAETIHAWRSQGEAVAFDGRTGSAAPIALINGTFAHALDFDDFHLASVHHVGAPTFAAAMALGMDRGLGGAEVLRAFVAGFEVGVRWGMNGTGVALADAGWHPTAVMGTLSSAAACATLLQLDETHIERGVNFAASQVAGLMASAGSIAKPLLVGKAACSGVMSATLAASGALPPPGLLQQEKGVLSVLFQRRIDPPYPPLDGEWQSLQNTFKPYAACQLTHASIDAARQLAAQISPDDILTVHACVNPLAPKVASHRSPRTPLQAKFSLTHCIAMSLLGHSALPQDFTDESVNAPETTRLRDRIEIVTLEQIGRASARLQVTLKSGQQIVQDVAAAAGSPERPMSMEATAGKFMQSATPLLGKDAGRLLETLKNFEHAGAMEAVARLMKATCAL
ncbi:MmgE/PrpD family protein [Ancylobacter polymorphus]|uniref:MmgE/PrpD family protein n=1 Tax=Ancylobacter polymorphus TaxID=223390 RepID=A0A9E6ZZP4_9HYPH|nr:MmgE/PrpD family protein [Ancylobacter polymorphus]UOK73306.1 MmgE/PrpD family protein [Ancylobacter polymorphus]